MNQEVILRIGPLSKLIEAMKTKKVSAVGSKWPSLPSWPILSITSWYAKVLHGLILGSNQFLLLPQQPLKKTFAICKRGKIDSKI